MARALAPRFTLLQNIVGAHLSHVRVRIILILRRPVGDSAGLLAEGLVIEGVRLQVALHLCLPGMDSTDTQFWLNHGPGKRSTPQGRTAGMMDATPRGEAQSEDVLPAVSRVMSSPNTGGVKVSSRRLAPKRRSYQQALESSQLSSNDAAVGPILEDLRVGQDLQGGGAADCKGGFY